MGNGRLFVIVLFQVQGKGFFLSPKGNTILDLENNFMTMNLRFHLGSGNDHSMEVIQNMSAAKVTTDRYFPGSRIRDQHFAGIILI
jgi:hypothetical protein